MDVSSFPSHEVEANMMAGHLQPFDPDAEYYDDASEYMTPAMTPPMTPQDDDDAFSSVSAVPGEWGADAPAVPATPGISDDA
eukprot:15344052-Alexandrium_andersonii.AAC.1